MYRAALLMFLVVLAHTPIMADAGVYELPPYPSFCDDTDLPPGV